MGERIMRRYWQRIVDSWRVVFARKRYATIAVTASLLLVLLNLLFVNLTILKSSFSFSLLGSLLYGTAVMMGPFGFALLLSLSVLGGITLAYSIFLIARQAAASSAAGLAGVLSGVVAPSCPSCAIGILPALGLTGFLSSLPFRGAELGLIGLGIVLAAMVYLSGKVVGVCRLEDS